MLRGRSSPPQSRCTIPSWELETVRDLSSVQFPRPPALGGQTPFGLRRLLTPVRARLRRRRLDAALVAGADPCDSPVLAYRAARLTSERSRERLAASVDGVLAAAARPARALSAAVEPHRDEVADAGPLLAQVGEVLRSRAPVYSQGVAMLEQLLKDGGSPLYLPAWPGALNHELELIIAALEGREETRSPWSSGPANH
jgi:hypothetical protein